MFGDKITDLKASGGPQIAPRVRWIFEQVGQLQPATILDVGCWRKPAVHRGLVTMGGAVVGVDIVAGDGVDVVADARALPFAGGTFGCVVCGEVLEHVWDGYCLLAELARVGWAVIVTTPNPYGLSRLRVLLRGRGILGDPDHRLLWTLDSLVRAFEELGLEIGQARTVGLRVPGRPWMLDVPLGKWGANVCVVARRGG